MTTEARNEIRWHPLLSQWIIVASNTAERPWSGAVSSYVPEEAPAHDPECYLCTGVVRPSGKQNPDYQGTWVFDNDYSSLTPIHGHQAKTPGNKTVPDGDDALCFSLPAAGQCRVICWSEHHNRSLANLDLAELKQVVRTWQQQYRELADRPDIAAVLIFENKGSEIGTSNPHPHGQIYASGWVPETAERMRTAQYHYAQQQQGKELIQQLIARPEYAKELLVYENTGFKVIVPYFARYAFETWIVPKRHVSSVSELSDNEQADLAAALQTQLNCYDRLFERPSPNMTHLYNVPCDNNPQNQHWCFFIDMLPPLRDKHRLKYMAGWETGSNTIVNPVSPTVAANLLRQCLVPSHVSGSVPA